jgi:hypothetical protein
MLLYKIFFSVLLLVSGAQYTTPSFQVEENIPSDIQMVEDISRQSIHNVLSVAILRLERDTARVDKQVYNQILVEYEIIMDRTNAIYAEVARQVVSSNGFAHKDPLAKRPALRQDLANATADANELLERVQSIRRELSPTVKKFSPTEIIAGATIVYIIWDKLTDKYNCTKAYRLYTATYWRSLDEIRENKLQEIPWQTVVGSGTCAEQIEKIKAKELKKALQELENLSKDSKTD